MNLKMGCVSYIYIFHVYFFFFVLLLSVIIILLGFFFLPHVKCPVCKRILNNKGLLCKNVYPNKMCCCLERKQKKKTLLNTRFLKDEIPVKFMNFQIKKGTQFLEWKMQLECFGLYTIVLNNFQIVREKNSLKIPNPNVIS